MTQWYAIRTATNRERHALAALDEQGFATFLPCETIWRRLRSVKEQDYLPLFPGYLFVLCAPEDWADVRALEAVHQFVQYLPTGSADAEPAPIPFAAIIAIQAAERAGVYDRTRNRRPPYQPRKGDKVKIAAGTWMGFIAKVLATPRGQRAHLMIEGPFGRGVTLDVARLSAA